MSDTQKESKSFVFFVISKIAFLAWAAALAGSIDKWKNASTAINDGLVVYAAFWLALFLAGLLFVKILNVNNNSEISSLMRALMFGIVVPLIGTFFTLVAVSASFTPNFEVSTIISFLAFMLSGSTFYLYTVAARELHLSTKIQKFLSLN